MSGCGVCPATALWDESGPTCASPAPLAASVDRGERRHETYMKNAPGYGPRQRRQVQGVLGREFGSLKYSIYVITKLI